MKWASGDCDVNRSRRNLGLKGNGHPSELCSQLTAERARANATQMIAMMRHQSRATKKNGAQVACYAFRVNAASVRRAARANWEITVDRGGVSPSEHDDEDCRYWLRIPASQRAAATWQLSAEIFELAARNAGIHDEEAGARVAPGDLNERRLPRAAFRLTRR